MSLSVASSSVENASEETSSQNLQTLLQSEIQELNRVLIQKLASKVGRIQDIGRYLALAGGKRIRPLMTLAITKLLNGDINRAIHLSACVELIHTATLLHDDVVDHAAQRRNKKAAHTVWSNASAVLTGDFLFSRAFELMVEDGNLPVLQVLSQASSTIAEGEVQQLCMSHNIAMSVEEALQIMSGKTASLFSAATKVGTLISTDDTLGHQRAALFGHHFGIAFQLTDDILDYEETKKTGKEAGNDFAEGKVTLPVIMAYETATNQDKPFWEEVFAKEEGQRTPQEFEKAQLLILSTKSLDRCRQLAQSHTQEALDALQYFSAHPIRAALENMCRHVVNRAQ
ncbi:polyprenyl synthetase family protein [Alphaproteobacteria bacterium]|nr:polyprenyl synthetase family protein [Alphaproteobacteria bacterium]